MGYSNSPGWNDEDVDNRHPWLRSLWEARRSAREAYSTIPPSTGTDRTVFAPESQQLAHIFLVDYLRHLGPLADDDDALQELWAETVHTTSIPEPGGTYTLESEPMLFSTASDSEVGVDLQTAVQGLESTTRDISLASVLEWWDTNNEIRFFVEAPGGQEVRSVTVYLPRAGMGSCLQQTDLCLHELNWLPDAATGTYRADEDDVLTHP